MTEDTLNNYKNFVEAVTSDASNDIDVLIERLRVLKNSDVNISLMLTAGIGMADEGGEFLGIVKKVLLHGKPLTDDVQDHLRSELGDVMWYWVNGCRALDIDPYEVMEKNVKKLEARYPGGSFDIYNSENRTKGDR